MANLGKIDADSVRCPTCGGIGVPWWDDQRPCSTCAGFGDIVFRSPDPPRINYRRLLLAFVGLLVFSVLAGLLARTAKADDIIIQFNATNCVTCYPPYPPTLPVIDLDATITVEPHFGTFYAGGGLGAFTGVEDVVESITGTLNGEPISGGTGWLFRAFIPGDVQFRAGDAGWTISSDPPYTLLNSEPIVSRIEVVQSPEPPASELLLVFGGLCVVLFYSRKKAT